MDGELTIDNRGWVNGVGISPVSFVLEDGEPTGIVFLNPDGTTTDATAEVTPSVLWDEAAQEAVRNTAVGPTIASRAYGMVHTAIFDAWAAYDRQAIATQLGDDLQQPASQNTIENKTEAMSYAAYRTLADLFPTQIDLFDSVMAQLGLDPANTSTNPNTPAGIGNLSAEALLEFRHADGSNQLGDLNNGAPYSDYTGYEPVNPPQGQEIADPNRWQPLLQPLRDPNGTVQQFLTPQWGQVIPFGLESGNQFRPPTPPEFGSEEFLRLHEEVIEISANLNDQRKIIAEFWEDGSGTSFPPGTWMGFGQFVSERDDNSLDEDAQMFFMLGNAVMDAGIAAWESKVFYDYVRPITAIEALFNGQTIEAWGGPGQGTVELDGSEFIPYQRLEAPTPPFAEYVSGHSSFSSAAAEVLLRFTGSDVFGASVTAPAGESLFEPGFTPTEPVTLSWETFSEAAIESGISRLYGGIHNQPGNAEGAVLGRAVGEAVWEQAQFFIEGGDPLNEILGTPRGDRLIGTEGDDRVLGLAGNDRLLGNVGNDSLVGGPGRDTLNGGTDSDTLLGGGDRDLLIGGPDSDTFLLVADTAAATLAMADLILAFQVGTDRIGLANGLTQEDLTLELLRNSTVIRLTESNNILGIVTGVTPDRLSDSFVSTNIAVF